MGHFDHLHFTTQLHTLLPRRTYCSHTSRATHPCPTAPRHASAWPHPPSLPPPPRPYLKCVGQTKGSFIYELNCSDRVQTHSSFQLAHALHTQNGVNASS